METFTFEIAFTLYCIDFRAGTKRLSGIVWIGRLFTVIESHSVWSIDRTWNSKYPKQRGNDIWRFTLFAPATALSSSSSMRSKIQSIAVIVLCNPQSFVTPYWTESKAKSTLKTRPMWNVTFSRAKWNKIALFQKSLRKQNRFVPKIAQKTTFLKRKSYTVWYLCRSRKLSRLV